MRSRQHGGNLSISSGAGKESGNVTIATAGGGATSSGGDRGGVDGGLNGGDGVSPKQHPVQSHPYVAVMSVQVIDE